MVNPNKLSKEMADAIDARSDELIREFREHAAGVREELQAQRPDVLERDGRMDMRKVFEGWAIQKIASLQLLVLDLVQRVEELESKGRVR